jgi:hypothetical protein
MPFLSISFVYSVSSMSGLTFSRIDLTSFYLSLRVLVPWLTPHLLCSSISLLHITWLPLDLLRVTNFFHSPFVVAPLTVFFPYLNFPLSHFPPYSTPPMALRTFFIPDLTFCRPHCHFPFPYFTSCSGLLIHKNKL